MNMFVFNDWNEPLSRQSCSK